MRTIYNTNGTDVTSTVKAYLLANRTLLVRELWWFQFVNSFSYNPYGYLLNYYYANAEWPIAVNWAQKTTQLANINATFLPVGGNGFKGVRRGNLTYGIGFEDNPLDATFLFDNTTQIYPDVNAAAITFKQCVSRGYLFERPVWLYRAFLSDPQTLLGTTLMFRGYIRGSELTRDSIKLTCASLMDQFQNTQVPTQTVQPGNRRAPYLPGYGGNIGSLTGLPGGTPTDLLFTHAVGDMPIPSDGALRDCCMVAGSVFQYSPGTNATPPPTLVPIRDNKFISGVEHIYPYEPVDVGMIYTTGVYTYFVSNAAPITNTGPDHATGFPNVPPPELGGL